MLKNSVSPPCPRPNPHEPEAELKEKAKRLPAYEAYRGVVTRCLGLHHWLAGNYRDGLIALGLFLLIVAGIIVTNVPGILDSNHEHFCCYPPDAPRGTLGSCKDPDSTVHDHPDKQACAGHGPKYWIVTVAYVCVALVLYYFADVSKLRFYKKCEEQFKTLKEAIVIPKNQSLQSDPEQIYYAMKGDIVAWQNRHPGIYILQFMPESFLFGLHFRTFGKSVLYYVYNLCFWTGSIFALLFFTTALPMDKAWRCYPDASLQNTHLGRCDNPKSTAAQQYHTKNLQHTEFFWIAVSIWSAGHAIAIGLFLYSTIFFRSLYASHVAKMLGAYKKAKEYVENA